MKEKTASGRRLLAFVYDKNGNLTAQEDVAGKPSRNTAITCWTR